MNKGEAGPRIVMTGMGVVTPMGNIEKTWQGVMQGESAISSVDLSPIDAHVAGKVHDFDPESHFNESNISIGGRELPYKRHARGFSRATHFALAASLSALRQAKAIDERNNYKLKRSIDPRRFGTTIGTGIGGEEVIGDIQMQLEQGRKARPTQVLEMLPERISTVPSMVFGLEGVAFAPAAACATGNISITAGIKEIRLGEADAMLVGSSEGSVHTIAASFFRGAQTLTKETHPHRAGQPFNRDRDGFVLGEGAGVFVIERLEHALARKAQPLVEIVGYGNASDADNETSPNGIGAYNAMILALRGLDSLIDNQEVFVSAHATATVAGDPVEAGVINRALHHARTRYVHGPKGNFGHQLGASGSIEAVLAAKTIQTGIIPPTLKLTHPIEETCGLTIPTDGVLKGRPTIAINNSFGFGGINSVVVFKRYES